MLKKGLIVSVQPFSSSDTFYNNNFILSMAQAAEQGNAVALRIEGEENIRNVASKITIPIIGLIKTCSPIANLNKRCITPKFTDIEKVYKSGADIIAVDFTIREKSDKKFYKDLCHSLNDLSDIKILADVSSIDEAMIAEDCGVTYVSSTLTGYTELTKDKKIPNINILKQFNKRLNLPYFAEGGFNSFDSIKKAFSYGAHCVVIGTAITRPNIITYNYSKYIKALIK